MAEPAPVLQGTRIGEYTLVKEAGKGEFSIVCKAQRKENDYHAIKRLLLKTEREDTSLLLESSTKLDQHNNVIKYISFYFHSEKPVMYLVTEYCNTVSLNDQMIKGNVNDPLKLAFMEDISKGLSHLHKGGIIHGDLRPPNILLSSGPRRPVCKISDYMLCLIQQQAKNPSEAREVAEYFEAPEVTSKKLYSKAADVYSLALVFYVITSEKQTTRNKRDLLVPAVRVGDKNFTVSLLVKEGNIADVMLPKFSNLESLGKLIVDMLELRPTDRPTTEDVLARMTDARQTLAAKTLRGDAALLMLMKMMDDLKK